MPTIEENLVTWQKDHDWQEGNEWSKPWGGPEPQWFGSLFPRIHVFLPTKTILEIAPGFGRWTQFLKDYCEQLIVVDLAERCIEGCKKRFQADAHITYHVNDGLSLAMIPDKSLDFVFSFDSLVHAEADVIKSYLDQLAEKLNKDGVGFIHHSNLGTYIDRTNGQLPFENPHWRAKSMTSRLFEEYCEKSNLQCIAQELIKWDGDHLTDCLSLFTPRDSIWFRSNRVLTNDKFMSFESQYIRHLSEVYAATSFELKSTSLS